MPQNRDGFQKSVNSPSEFLIGVNALGGVLRFGTGGFYLCSVK